MKALYLISFWCVIFLGLSACTNPQTPESEVKIPPSTTIAEQTKDQNPQIAGKLRVDDQSPPHKEKEDLQDGSRPEVVEDKEDLPVTGQSLPHEDKGVLVCSFPIILKVALEQQLNQPCSAITTKDLSKITSLDISHTDISELSPKISELKNLQELNISATKIKNLGPELCHLQNLTTLKASHNTYEGNEMPLAIVCLSNLKTLDLSYSSLQYIDEYIFYLKKLENINLKGNHLMNLPAMLALMPSLTTIDLRENWFEYPSINALYDCSQFEKSSDERKECQEDILQDVQCEYWYEIPEDCSHLNGDEDEEALEQKALCEKAKFKRGKLGNNSFIKRYEEMTGEKHVEKHARDDGHLKARCYHFWINQYVFYGNPDDPKRDPETEFLNLNLHNHPDKRHIISQQVEKKHQYLLDLTINGKTMREIRLLLDEISKNSGNFLFGRYAGCFNHIKGKSFRDTIEVIKGPWNFKTAIPNTGRVLYHSVTDFFISLKRFLFPRDTSYAPSHSESHPERFRALDWNERPEKTSTELCKPIDLSTPIPSGPLGPWSKALPAVQSLIEEKYLEPRWNECENWPVSQCHDFEARIKEGKNPGGFMKEQYRKKEEKANRQRRIKRDKLREIEKQTQRNINQDKLKQDL